MISDAINPDIKSNLQMNYLKAQKSYDNIPRDQINGSHRSTPSEMELQIKKPPT